jgi:hypothetical protein
LLAGAIWNERASWPSPADCGAEIERLRDCARREIELRGPAALRDLRIRGDWRDAKRRALPVRTDAEVVDEYARRSFIGFCRGHGIEDEFVDYVYASAVAGKWLQPHVDAGLGDVHEPSRYLPTTTTRRLRPAGRRGRVWSPWQLDEKWRAVEEAVRAEIHASGLKWSRSRVGQTWNAHDLAVRVQRRLPLWFPDDHDTLRTIEKWLRGPGAYVVLTA